MAGRRRFLSADWRWLAMLNYRVPPQLIEPLVPEGTEVDLWQGDAFLSVVAFRFTKVRVMGIPIPFHTDFDEINLRFYVRRESAGEVRRGVVFIREVAPRAAVALLARVMYNEPYAVMKMSHRVPSANHVAGTPSTVEYSFKQFSRWSRLSVTPAGAARLIPPSSEEEFLSVRHWGYTPQRDGGTIEYHVEHPRWNVWDANEHALDADVGSLYGEPFGEILRRPADSAYLVDGSAISVSLPERIA